MRLICEWTGDGFTPLQRFKAEADKTLVVHERYVIDTIEERSARSHRQYFARIKDYWMSLPDAMLDRFPTPEHLRKYCLIKAGYADSRSIVEASKAAALRLAAFLRPIDEFAIVTIEQCVVTIWTAKSQSHKSMDKATFQESKDAVFEILENLLQRKNDNGCDDNTSDRK